MVSWNHPSLGPIHWLPPELQPEKVWKHFYSYPEHWERISPMAPQDVANEVFMLLAVDRAHTPQIPALGGEAGDEARRLLIAHHHKGYGPAYYSEMKAPATRWGTSNRGHARQCALTPQSVFLVVQLDSRTKERLVITAFRPHDGSMDVDWNEEQFHEHATWKFEKDTMSGDKSSLTSMVANRLRRSLRQRMDDPGEQFLFASALSYARNLGDCPELEPLLTPAESLWHTESDNIVATLRPRFLWDNALDDIAAGLKDQHPDELERALDEAEELLAVGELCGLEDRCGDFVEKASALLDWIPEEWSYLGEYAAQRAGLFALDSSPMVRFWRTLDGCVAGTLIRTTEPARRPQATLVDELLPERPTPQLWDRIRGIGGKLVGPLASPIVNAARDFAGFLDVAPPVPVMGGELGPELRGWDVVCKSGSPAGWTRVFVIDESGHVDEVSDLLPDRQLQSTKLWTLDSPGETVLVVVFASEAPETLMSFEGLLEAAERDEVGVAYREFSRPKQ